MYCNIIYAALFHINLKKYGQKIQIIASLATVRIMWCSVYAYCKKCKKNLVIQTQPAYLKKSHKL